MVRRLIGTVLSLGMLVGCGHDQSKTVDNALAAELKDAPEWVRGDCKSWFKKNSQSVVCGVGSVAGTANISLARSGATGRARTEIARGLAVKVKSMLKDYQATATGGDQFKKAAMDEQQIQDVSKQITDQTIEGTEVNQTWISGQGTFWALVSMNAAAFGEQLKQMKSLDEAIRAAVAARAEKAFSELDDATGPR